jgi:hypothetical protein
VGDNNGEPRLKSQPPRLGSDSDLNHGFPQLRLSTQGRGSGLKYVVMSMDTFQY